MHLAELLRARQSNYAVMLAIDALYRLCAAAESARAVIEVHALELIVSSARRLGKECFYEAHRAVAALHSLTEVGRLPGTGDLIDAMHITGACAHTTEL